MRNALKIILEGVKYALDKISARCDSLSEKITQLFETKADKMTDEETIALLAETDLIDVVVDSEGNILTDSDGNVIIL